jgi:hypothetical protein
MSLSTIGIAYCFYHKQVFDTIEYRVHLSVHRIEQGMERIIIDGFLRFQRDVSPA